MLPSDSFSHRHVKTGGWIEILERRGAPTGHQQQTLVEIKVGDVVELVGGQAFVFVPDSGVQHEVVADFPPILPEEVVFPQGP